MRSIVIIGGGLTGLAAAWELETLGVDYTLIEVKPRLGGSVVTERVGGSILDGGAFVHEQYGAWPFLEELGFDPAMDLLRLGRYRDGELVAFADGTGALVDRLAARITPPIMYRMAVSSLGALETTAQGVRWGVCLENGLTLDARGLIVTAPARYAAHMLLDLDQATALYLSEYQYDPAARISLVVSHADAAQIDIDAVRGDLGAACKAIALYPTLGARLPGDHALLRLSVRVDPVNEITSPGAALARVQAAVGVTPVLSRVHFWPEADPLTRHLPEHADAMTAIEAALPATVALAGSDYRARRIDEQIAHGRAAARQVAATL